MHKFFTLKQRAWNSSKLKSVFQALMVPLALQKQTQPLMILLNLEQMRHVQISDHEIRHHNKKSVHFKENIINRMKNHCDCKPAQHMLFMKQFRGFPFKDPVIPIPKSVVAVSQFLLEKRLCKVRYAVVVAKNPGKQNMRKS